LQAANKVTRVTQFQILLIILKLSAGFKSHATDKFSVLKLLTCSYAPRIIRAREKVLQDVGAKLRKTRDTGLLLRVLQAVKENNNNSSRKQDY
jgi:hypothetical protein